MIKTLILRSLCITAMLMSCTNAPARSNSPAESKAADQSETRPADSVDAASPTKESARQWAVVNVSDAFLRQEARYGSECVSQTRMGTLVQVLERKGYWVRVRTPEPYEGWINELSLAPQMSQDAAAQKKSGQYGPTLNPMTDTEADAYVSAPKFIVTEEHAKIYSPPDDDSDIVCNVLMSNILRKGNRPVKNEMYSVILPDGREGWIEEDDVKDFSVWASREAAESDRKKIADIISLAKSFLGCPYFWGGMSAGHFDCSGLVGFCFFMNGVLLPRDAYQQVNCGVEISFEDMQAGDLVFFGNSSIAHVGLCIGDHRIIHSSQLVRINSLLPEEKDYYGRNILHIRRIFGHMEKGGNGFRARLISGEAPYFKLD